MSKQHLTALAGQGGASFNYFKTTLSLVTKGHEINLRSHEMINWLGKTKKQKNT